MHWHWRQIASMSGRGKGKGGGGYLLTLESLCIQEVEPKINTKDEY